mgnify:CR=1 FL=1
MSVTSKALKVRFGKPNDESLLMTFGDSAVDAKNNITASQLTDTSTGLLAAAIPVLGVNSVQEAYYVTTIKETIIG